MNMQGPDVQDAETIAIAGLQRLADKEDLLMRFCAVTGITTSDMRNASAQPGYLVGVLDFFLAHEPDLLAWAEADGIPPESIVNARHALAASEQAGFE